jgi:hypothetical protein
MMSNTFAGEESLPTNLLQSVWKLDNLYQMSIFKTNSPK